MHFVGADAIRDVAAVAVDELAHPQLAADRADLFLDGFGFRRGEKARIRRARRAEAQALAEPVRCCWRGGGLADARGGEHDAVLREEVAGRRSDDAAGGDVDTASACRTRLLNIAQSDELFAGEIDALCFTFHFHTS